MPSAGPNNKAKKELQTKSTTESVFLPSRDTLKEATKPEAYNSTGVEFYLGQEMASHSPSTLA